MLIRVLTLLLQIDPRSTHAVFRHRHQVLRLHVLRIHQHILVEVDVARVAVELRCVGNHMRVQRRGARKDLFTDIALHGLLGRALDGVRLHVRLEIAALTEALAADGAREWSVGEGEMLEIHSILKSLDPHLSIVCVLK
jgi:hypothetical protein